MLLQTLKTENLVNIEASLSEKDAGFAIHYTSTDISTNEIMLC